MKSYILLLGFIFLPLCLKAQYFDDGQDPAYLKWSQIQTENFEIIFPDFLAKDAKRLAVILEKVYVYGSVTLNVKPKKISVILHPQTAVSNAFVILAPRRTEFNTIPPQDIYPQDWLEQLAIHEFRHVVQMDKMNQSFTRVLYYIFGEQAVGAMVGLFIPRWFLEGDAVLSETALSETGRGRAPEFTMPLKAQLIEKGRYHYEKAYFGSYKDFVPDHYVLGYHLVGAGRNTFSPAIWNKAMKKAAGRPYMFTPFSRGIRNVSGLNKWKFYDKFIDSLRIEWERELDTLNSVDYVELISSPEKVFTNYRFPQFLNDKEIVALKSGLSHIPQFVRVFEGKEEHIFSPGIFHPVRISANNNRILWAEYVFDKRWGQRVYSDIFIYDVIEKKRKRITERKFLFSPVFNRDGTKIAAVEIPDGSKYYLSVLNPSGEEIITVQHPDNDFIITPVWGENTDGIYAIMLGKNGKRIDKIDLVTGSFLTLYSSGNFQISQLEYNNEKLFFRGTFSGVDNIYELNLRNNNVNKVTSVPYGAFDPMVKNSALYFSNYSADGFRLSSININDNVSFGTDTFRIFSNLYHDAHLQERGVPNLTESIITVVDSASIKPYQKWKSLFNFHSWSPVYNDPDESEIGPGFSVLSQNKLSTSFATIGYLHNYTHGSGSFNASYSYRGWYPVIDFSTSLGKRVYYDTASAEYFQYGRNSYQLGSYLPLNFTRGKYFRFFTPGITTQWVNFSDVRDTIAGLSNGDRNITEYFVNASRMRRMAHRDLLPRWGQRLRFSYRHSPFGGQNYGYSFTASAALLFPGIMRHHSLLLRAGYERIVGGEYSFPGTILFPRGYLYQGFSLFRILSGEYRLPLFYPDFKLGPVLYMKRVKGNIFYDYAIGSGAVQNEFNSTGIDIVSDIHLFNFVVPYEFGGRFIYLPEVGKFTWQVIFAINFADL